MACLTLYREYLASTLYIVQRASYTYPCLSSMYTELNLKRSKLITINVQQYIQPKPPGLKYMRTCVLRNLIPLKSSIKDLYLRFTMAAFNRFLKDCEDILVILQLAI